MRLLLLIVALLGIFNLSPAYVIDGCGIGSIDFSSLNNYDISFNSSGWTYVLRMCGIVRDALCLSDPTSNSAMLCQRTGTANNNFYGLMTWGVGRVGTWGTDGAAVTYAMSTGEQCNSQITTPRGATLRFECDSTATTPRISAVSEPSTCQYLVVVRTNLVCAANPCTFLGVDLSPISPTGNLSWVNGEYTWFVNLCNRVGDSYCQNDTTTLNSMVCQRRNDLLDAYSIANYNSTVYPVSYSVVSSGNSAGLLGIIRNGEYCGAVGANRVTRIQLVCDRSLSSSGSYISGISETSTCVYQVTIYTSITCPFTPSSTGSGTAVTSSWWPIPTGNCTFTYSGTKNLDFNYLMNGADLLYQGFIGGTYYNLYYHLCGVVRNPQCLNDSTTYNSMICQASVTSARDNWAIGTFDRDSMHWGDIQYGVQYYQESGELCGSIPRRVTVQFICNPRVSRDTIISATEPSGCNYLMIIHTPSTSVCNGYNYLPETSVDDPMYRACVYPIGKKNYDFKLLNPANGSDFATTFISPTNRTDRIFMKICGKVSDPVCSRDQTSTNAMICQNNPGVNSYSLADYVEDNMIWRQVPNENIIQLKMVNGEACDGSKKRTVTVDFVCDLRYPTPQMIFFNETYLCEYRLKVAANLLMCNFDVDNPDGSANSGSDNMNGGMIALVVIVIILGLIILIGACAVWRYYDRPTAYQKNTSYEKNVEMQNQSGEAHSYEVEESQSTV